MKLKLLMTLLTVIISLNSFAQHADHSHNHNHHKNEIGISVSPVWFVKESVFSYGIHLHYARTIADSKFGLGLGVERIFDEHKHNTLGLEMIYRPIERLSISISPGIAAEDGNPKVHFAFHQETTYEFEIKKFHIGPALEFAFDREDIHISFGIHIGYGF